MTLQLIQNKAKCLLCDDTVESKHRHDFVGCSCGNLMLDGGTSYQRTIISNPDKVQDLSVYWTGDNFEEVRKVFTWKTYGKNLEFKQGKYLKLKDMTTEHIEAILDTQEHIKGTYVEKLFKLELEWRKVTKD